MSSAPLPVSDQQAVAPYVNQMEPQPAAPPPPDNQLLSNAAAVHVVFPPDADFPQGHAELVPNSRLHDALTQGGGKMASFVQFPDGHKELVSTDNLHAAITEGQGQLVQPSPKPGLAQRVGESLKGMFSSIPTVTSPYPGMDLERKQEVAQQSAAEDQVRQQEGHGTAYRLAAPVAEAVGAPVSTMEEGAREGDPNKVLGAAVAGAGVAAAPLAAEGALHAPGVVRDVANHLIPAAPMLDEATEVPRANFAASRIAKLIKPMAGDVKYGADPAQSLPREGITGGSLEDLGEKVYSRARDVGQTIDAVAQAPENANKVVDIAPAVNGPIEDAIRNAVRTGDKPLYDKLQAYKQQVTNVWKEVADEEGNKSLKSAGPRKLQLSPMDAIKLKRDIADMTRWSGDPMDNEVNAVKARQFGGIKDAVNQAVPDLVELNQRYADLVNAGKAIERRAPVAARSNDFSLGDLGTMIAGKALTGSSGVGIAAEVARRASHSPGVISRVANSIMPESLKYEEPAAIRARLKGGEPPKGAPEGGRPPQPERRGTAEEKGARQHVFTAEERAANEANHQRALRQTQERLGPLSRQEIITGKPVSILSGQD